MKRYLLALFVFMLGCKNQPQFNTGVDSLGDDAVIYGQDSIKKTSELSNDSSPKFKTNLQASAALIKDADLETANNDYLNIPYTSVREKFSTCASYKMSDEPSLAFCSATLIAPNKVLTAGHCFSEEENTSCANTSIVFGYNDVDAKGNLNLNAHQVFHCKRITTQAKSDQPNSSKLDFAIVELDRSVINFKPVLVSKSQPFQKNINSENIYTIGYPVGVPKRVATGQIRTYNAAEGAYVSSLDVFFGNSGSAVFAEKTNQIIGILLSGEADFVKKSGCYQPKKCTDDGCMGERILPIAKIYDYL